MASVLDYVMHHNSIHNSHEVQNENQKYNFLGGQVSPFTTSKMISPSIAAMMKDNGGDINLYRWTLSDSYRDAISNPTT